MVLASGYSDRAALAIDKGDRVLEGPIAGSAAQVTDRTGIRSPVAQPQIQFARVTETAYSRRLRQCRILLQPIAELPYAAWRDSCESCASVNQIISEIRLAQTLAEPFLACGAVRHRPRPDHLANFPIA